MNAGRALDALVAEKVMGWDVPDGIALERYWKWPPGFKGFPHGNLAPCPHFSTDIAAAWLVMEKLRERWAVELHGRDNAWCCLAEEGDEVTGHFIATSEADTAPLAICLAALKAMGVEV